MNIGIIGVGGVGGYFGGKLAKRFENSKENHIYFLARGEHFKEIKKNGLTLIMNGKDTINCKPYIISDDVKDFPMLDVCLICVKGYHLKNVLENLKVCINEKTEVVPLLNGIDIPHRIHSIIPNALVYPSCVYVGTHIKCPGVVQQNGGDARIVTGQEASNKLEVNKPKFLKLFDEADINYEYTEENYKAIWGKYMFVGPYSIVAAYYDKTLGQINDDPNLVNKVEDIANLILNIAHKEGIDLAESMPKDIIKKAEAFPYDTKTSFQRDFETKVKPVEKETFIDALIILAKKYNLDASCVLDVINR